MRLYVAGLYASNFDLHGRIYASLEPHEKADRKAAEFILESYHYVKIPRLVQRMRADGAKVFLDSGAFTAFTKGVEVNLEDYCKYVVDNQDLIIQDDGQLCFSVLDAIGDAQATYDNQIRMERLGARPLPCYHYGEDPRWLEWYIHNYPYVTIGGMVPISKQELIPWLDRLWSTILTDGAGNPKCKIHAFGITTMDIFHRYPWYSVDSATWVNSAGFGMIQIPFLGAFPVSEHSPEVKNAGRHLDNLPPPQRDSVLRLIAGRGYTVERLSSVYASRWAFNIKHFANLGASHNVHRFESLQMDLFHA